MGNLRKNRTLSNIFGDPTNSVNWRCRRSKSLQIHLGLSRRKAHLRLSLITSGKIKHCRTSSEIRLDHCQIMRRISWEIRHQIERRPKSQCLEIRLIQQIEQSSSVTAESRVIKKLLPKSSRRRQPSSSQKSNSVEHFRQFTTSASRTLSKHS